MRRDGPLSRRMSRSQSNKTSGNVAAVSFEPSDKMSNRYRARQIQSAKHQGVRVLRSLDIQKERKKVKERHQARCPSGNVGDRFRLDRMEEKQNAVQSGRCRVSSVTARVRMR